MKQLFFFISVIVLHLTSLSGQVLYSDIQMFTVNDGLSQSHVTCLMQDSRGFIWIGTEDGLNRYDGYDFVKYNYQPYDTNSLSSNYINAICEDKDGILWIATNKGLTSYDLKNDLYIRYFCDEDRTQTISSNLVLNVYIDKKNTLWIKTLKSLDQFDFKTKTFHRYAHFSDPVKISYGNVRYPVYEDNEDRLWIGTKEGLSFFDRKLQLYNRYISLEYNSKSISHDEVRSIIEDKDRTLWIGTAYGLNAFYPGTKEFKRYYIDFKSKELLNRNHINALYEDKAGQLWTGTMKGLYIFNKHTGIFEQVVNSSNISLSDPVYSIIYDRSGSIWIGTLKGLIKINVQEPKFKLYRAGLHTAYSFSSNDVGSLYSPEPKILFIGTWDKGLDIFNTVTNNVRKFEFSSGGTEQDNYIHSIFRLNEDKYFLGTNNGILVFNPLTGNYYNFSRDTVKGGELLLQKRVNSIVHDSMGNIWIGTIYGLYKYNMAKSELTTYLNNPENANSICNNNINCLTSDKDGNIWIGTENGLDFFNRRSKTFTHYTDGPKSKPALSNGTVFGLQFDKEGYLWIGTASGLNKLNIKEKTIKVFTKKEGLSDNLISAVLLDNNQNVWASTNHGMNKVNPRNNEIFVFDVYDGLQGYEFNLNAACRSKDGELFFGGVAGINAFYPDSLKRNNFIPQVVITSIEITTADGKIQYLDPFSDKIIVPYKAHSFSVYFASLDYTIPEKNNFSYKLNTGKESSWINIGNKHWVTFSNLKPGEYDIYIKGSNNDLVWNENPVTVKVVIDSPYWLKTEAYYLYIFLLILSVLGVYRFRTYRLRISNKILKEREITTHQVEQQKELLAVKNRNITDSINYAKRIQEALMPSEKNFKKILPESFVFHQPKDIVSGDFFWVSERGNKIYVAAVDCTGHGVPGAFMSIIGFELFRNITHSRGVDDPSQILSILNHEFEEIFRDVENFTFKDGMDIAFCVIDKSTRILEFSGAVNPIYLIRDNKITEIRGSRFSVGLDDNCEEEQTFENKQIVLQEDDMFYLFSDGYADQFGGTEGKKFKYRRFRHLLLTIHQYSIEEQKRLLEERINRWKGDLEQVDDILVIGFRPRFINK
jgi:ligand-binding sensor domain-containing protein/serine phosphatase RsbU (regulator of sigma subunit)